MGETEKTMLPTTVTTEPVVDDVTSSPIVMEKNCEYVGTDVTEEKYKTIGLVKTGLNTLEFVIKGDYMTLRDIFKATKHLTIAPNDTAEPYGIYPDVVFEDAGMGQTDDEVRIVMHIMTQEEKDRAAIMEKLNEHDEILADILFGGEE